MPYNPNCPACLEKRFHAAKEWQFHDGEGRDGEDRRYTRSFEPVSGSQNPKLEVEHG